MSGGGGSTYYKNLDQLYGEQAQNAAQLRGQSDLTYQDLAALRSQANDYGSVKNQEQAAMLAAGDYQSSFDSQRRDAEANMASMGVNPGDERYAREERAGLIQGVGGQAAAMTGARFNAQDKGFARLQDVTSMGLGLPAQATSALNSAGNMAGNAAQLQMMGRQMNSASIGSAVRGGFDVYGMLAGMKDGGFVHLKGGGYVQRPKGYARGGIIGAMADIQPPPPPSGGAPAPSPLLQGAGLGVHAMGIPAVRQAVGQGLQTFGKGLQAASGVANPPVTNVLESPDPAAYQMAQQQVGQAASDIGLGATETSNAALTTGAGAGAADAAAALGATGAEGAGVALAGVGETVMDALPLLLLRNGGRVTPGSNGAQGGQVDGPGGPKDDKVPAMLSDGEFVMPIGAVKKFGLDRLEKMRQQGLEFEKQLGIT